MVSVREINGYKGEIRNAIIVLHVLCKKHLAIINAMEKELVRIEQNLKELEKEVT